MMDLLTLVLACSLYANNAIPYAMVQTGSKGNPLLVSENNRAKHFKTAAEAIAYTQTKIAQGKQLNIGLMQISSQWLPEIDAPTEDLFRPCKNMVLATQMMNTLRLQCQTLAAHNPRIDVQACTLSMYKTGNTQTGIPFANNVIRYAAQHPFAPLVKKARDPGMAAATKKSKPTGQTADTQTS